MHKRIAASAIILGLFISLCTTPIVGATAAVPVVIAEVLTGTPLSASAEFVELHNQTSQDIDVEGWKIQYMSAAGTTISVKATLQGTLKANGSLFAATSEFGIPGDTTLSPGLPESGGRLRVVDASGMIIDALSWGSITTPSEGTPAPPPLRGQSLVRSTMETGILNDTDNNAADFTLSDAPIANGGDVYEPVDVCPNDDIFPGNQSVLPDGYQLDDSGNCIPMPSLPVEYPIIQLNEILPDPASPKTDANDEFIELYNPNDQPVNAMGYKILSGSSLGSVYTLPDYTIPSHGYVTLYSSETKISLSNSGSKLQLLSPDGNLMGGLLQYGAAGVDQVWALFGDIWGLSDKPTPGAVNEQVTETEGPDTDSGAEAAITPCPSGKYRNLLTNRCRNIETDAAILTACDDGEYRSPDTNRCRKLASLASTTVTPCDEGQERNPSTNRCRKIAGASTTALTPCKAGQERNAETNRCRNVTSSANTAGTITQPEKQGIDAVGGVALGIVGLVAVSYGVFEWRNEIVMAFGKLLAALGKK